MSTLGILGTGLIGSSIGLRARGRGVHVIGCDANAATAAGSLALGALDEIVSREALYLRSDIVAIAVPLEATCSELRQLRSQPNACELIVDVASVKVPVVAAAAGVANFAATHPLAGSEGRGPAAARADIFDGRSWAYVPSGDAVLDLRAQAFIRRFGAEPVAVGAGEHDAIVGLTSHLPQLLATLLAARIRSAGSSAVRLCGPAGLEVLRLGSSSYGLWGEILAANAGAVTVEGRNLAASLHSICDALERKDGESLRRAFAAAERRVDGPTVP